MFNSTLIAPGTFNAPYVLDDVILPNTTATCTGTHEGGSTTDKYHVIYFCPTVGSRYGRSGLYIKSYNVS
jgi:hypothetical protein